MNSITENEIEEIALSYLQSLGYRYLNGLVISPDGEHPERQYTDVVLTTRLRDAIDKLNPTITQDAKEDALKKVLRTESPNQLINNENFHRYLTDGVDVEVRTPSGISGEKVFIVDFSNPDNNEFLVVNQFTIIEGSQNKRPDLILFVNGLPLVVVELKNAVDENASVKSAYNQLQTYKQAIPSLFTYNELLIVSDGWDALCGTITSDFGRFMSWKTKDGKTTADHLQPQMEVMFLGMLNKTTLLDLIRQFIVFEKSDTKTLKKVAAYHQYYAVNKAVESTIIASSNNGDRRGGVIWHTQGSGKSLSMVFYSGKLIIEPKMENPTLVILTDRNDLDEQLHDTFTNCQQLLRQEPQKAEDRQDLRKLLKVASGGIVFTTIQKFMPMTTDIVQNGISNTVNEPSVEYIGAEIKALSERKNIVVVADEAHRSQYDFIDGFAKHLRDALPNASFIGFTGTPIETTDRNTQAVFGNYVDI
ncbi:MAG: DEAD/DEAH box helicase, partial [Bacteroidetes bacterium HGW-Bacteroidetes-19]